MFLNKAQEKALEKQCRKAEKDKEKADKKAVNDFAAKIGVKVFSVVS